MTPDSLSSSASSPATASTRRVPRGLVALGALALLAAMALITRRSPSEVSGPPSPRAPPSGAPSASAARAPSSSDSSSTAPSGQAQGHAPHFTPTTCWQDLERFNETVTLETFRGWATPLLASRDPLVLSYLKERLAELIGHDEARATQVLGWARDASPAEFKLLMAGLRGSQALVLPKVAAQLTSLGLDEKIDLGRRAGFLDELQRLPRLEPTQLAQLARFAQEASSGEAGWVTTRAIGRVMKEDYERTGNAGPYLDKLLTLGTESLDEHVRYLALEMEMHADAPLDAKSTERLAKLLATEGSGEVRQVAAQNLSLAQDKTQALDIYARTFAVERDVCVRWALFRFAARAAGKDALPTLADMALADPRFQGDYQNFERLYASGIVDFDRIWFGLPNQDPHGCLDHAD